MARHSRYRLRLDSPRLASAGVPPRAGRWPPSLEDRLQIVVGRRLRRVGLVPLHQSVFRHGSPDTYRDFERRCAEGTPLLFSPTTSASSGICGHPCPPARIRGFYDVWGYSKTVLPRGTRRSCACSACSATLTARRHRSLRAHRTIRNDGSHDPPRPRNAPGGRPAAS